MSLNVSRGSTLQCGVQQGLLLLLPVVSQLNMFNTQIKSGFLFVFF